MSKKKQTPSAPSAPSGAILQTGGQPDSAAKPGMQPGPLTPEQKAARKAKREANVKSQLSYQTILSNVAAESGQTPATVNLIVSTLKKVVGKGLLGDSVVMLGPDLGSFKVMSTEARKGRNPRTGEAIDIPAGKRVRFQPGSALKTLLLTGQIPSKPVRQAPTPAPQGAEASTDLPVGKPGQSERARKIAAKRALRTQGQQVEPVVPGPTSAEAAPESSVSDADIDSILNESLDGDEGETF